MLLFRGRDADPDPPYGMVPEQLPEQGRATAHREEAKEEEGGELVISSAGGSYGGSRF